MHNVPVGPVLLMHALHEHQFPGLELPAVVHTEQSIDGTVNKLPLAKSPTDPMN